jgi:hypothetical protein
MSDQELDGGWELVRARSPRWAGASSAGFRDRAAAMAFAPLLALLPGYRHFLVDLPGHNLAPPYRWQDRPLRDLAVDVVTELWAAA